ncbi:MAG: drug/metabolite exporter YedA [Phycisphaerae bacterium]|nr:drug/metabolite exporter YedA [Phycisphaerales bacterium]
MSSGSNTLESIATPPRMLLIVAAFAAIYIVWGSTYLAIRFAIESIPPFLMAGMRFLVAGSIMFGYLRLRNAPMPTRSNWRSAAIVGCLMLLGGNGLVCWAEQHVASGLAALLIATVPLWMVTLDFLLYRGPRPTASIALGLILGLVGIFILIGPADIGGEPIHTMGGIVLLLACVFWSIGSLHARRVNLPRSTTMSASLQMICAGVVFFVVGTLAGEWRTFDIAAVSAKSWFSLAYLIVFGAILALTAYNFLLQNCSPKNVSTYAYVNPVIAVVLGALLANETLSPRTSVAALIIIASVILITYSRKPKPNRDTTVYTQTDTVVVDCSGPTAIESDQR